MERAIGEVFECESFKYEVIADPDGAYNCMNCSFDPNYCDRILDIIGECAITFRKDKNSVCFKRKDRD